MGILNVTPDSFSDGGVWSDPRAAARHAFEMEDQGAGIIDVGAESTRPGSSPISAEIEISRLAPVLREIVPSLSVPVSVDTKKTAVARKAADLGADIINDVNGLRDPGMPELCAEAGICAIIMHNPCGPKDQHSSLMGDGYMDEIRDFLRERAAAALEAGIPRQKIALDPGIGFGKTPEQNLMVLRNSRFFSDGYPVLMASSRKRFLSLAYPGMDRDEASAEAAWESVRWGADMVRVHNVALTVRKLDRPR